MAVLPPSLFNQEGSCCAGNLFPHYSCRRGKTGQGSLCGGTFGDVLITIKVAGVVRPVRKLCRMFAVICWAAGFMRFGRSGESLYPSSPHAHWIVPALKTRAPLGAV